MYSIIHIPPETVILSFHCLSVFRLNVCLFTGLPSSSFVMMASKRARYIIKGNVRGTIVDRDSVEGEDAKDVVKLKKVKTPR